MNAADRRQLKALALLDSAEAMKLQILRLLGRPVAPAKTLPEPKRSERKAAKKESAKVRRALVRAACMSRAGDRCECCGVPGTALAPLEMDHFLGRARSESVGTCWMLCRQCHRDKTENRPSANHWRVVFSLHQNNNGYDAAARSAR